jgi:Zn/Cd-binding protein ZinT
MATEKIYVAGFRTFPKHEKSPDFVLGSLLITPNELFKFIKENSQYLTDYKGEKQLKCQILQGKNGINFVVDTYKKEEAQPKGVTQPDSDLPFNVG